MDSDFTGGKNKKGVQIEPLNDLSAPKVPHFDSLEANDTLPEVPEVKSEPPHVELPTTTEPTEPPKLNSFQTAFGIQKGTVVSAPTAAKPAKTPSRFWHFTWTRQKRTTIILAALSLVLIGAATTVAYLNQPRGQGSHTISKKPAFVPKETRVPNSLTGVLVDPAVNNRPVIGVMIENSEDARPQSGMDQAGIVFEAIAEGGITRFLTLYQADTPDYIGPVRSARPYYVQWCMSFDCAYAHAGGSPEALQNIRDWGTKDINDNHTTNWRIDSRYAPHNLYSSVPKLMEYAGGQGYGAASFTTLARKKDAASKTPNATSIDVNISSGMFNSHYDYDAASNGYKRSQAGAPHTVVNGGGAEAQLQPKIVVALIMPYSIASDNHSQYGVNGDGEAFVFQDGTVTHGAWHKADVRTALTLTDDAGAALTLNAGQTWFVALSGTDRLQYR